MKSRRPLPRVASITAGGAGMYCGSCMRDNTVTAALKRQGVDVTLIPTFTPIRTDEQNVSQERVFLGGINVYLEQRWPWFRRLPKPARRALDHPRLLSGLSKLALQTRRADDGALAVSLLRGEHGNQASEIHDLVQFVVEDLQPDLVNLTNLLIAGFVPALKERFGGPITATLQGDDIFLDSLPSALSAQVVTEMRRVSQLVDAFITFSEDYKRRMAVLLEIPSERIHVVPLGLADAASFKKGSAISKGYPTLGYLARICPEKGFDLLVDAVLELRSMKGTENLQFRFGGWLGASDRHFFDQQMNRLRVAGMQDAVDHVDLPDRPSKIEFLRSLDVLSVPTRYLEPKGLYILEALATGVTVVQPNHGSFPEILANTGGGTVYLAGNRQALVEALHRHLTDPGQRQRLGREGVRGVLEHHTDDAMASATLEVWRSLLQHQNSVDP